MSLKGYLKKIDGQYDPELCLLGTVFKSPGYHSNVPNGKWVHPIRESLNYALDLLREGSPRNLHRACDIVRRVVSLQDQDTASSTYGIWSWLYEEPLDKMTPPDWNWADFCGLYMAEIHLLHRRELPKDLRALILRSLDHAAGSIFRRNMGPHYTNISIMGGITTSLAGEILGDKRWLVYGERRLERCTEHYKFHGGYNEYNSPTYTWVVARDCERGLRLLTTPHARRLTKFLWHAAWHTIAEHFHPPTGQLAGPHSRSYSTFLSPEFIDWISSRAKIPLEAYAPPGTAPRVEFGAGDAFSLPCPPTLQRYFKREISEPYEIKRRFIRRSSDQESIYGTTWFSSQASLGSVNRDNSWDQRRTVLAYWSGAAGKPVALRLRFLHDGREFASCFVRNHQSGSEVLSAFHLLLDRGDFHPIWGGAPENVFQAKDFRVRYEIVGENLQVKSLRDGRFLIKAGHGCAYITPAACTFAGVKVPWRITRGENSVGIDAILYHGKQKAFDFKHLPSVRIAAGLQIGDDRKTAPEFRPLKWKAIDRNQTVFWEGKPEFKLTLPAAAITYQE